MKNETTNKKDCKETSNSYPSLGLDGEVLQFQASNNQQEIIEKPWGHEVIWAACEKYVGKQLYINGGHRLSLQKHLVKEETIMVQKGILTLVVEGPDGLEEKQLSAGESYHITPGTVHRFWAKNEPVLLVEVSTTELDDVVRIEDDFGRIQ